MTNIYTLWLIYSLYGKCIPSMASVYPLWQVYSLYGKYIHSMQIYLHLWLIYSNDLFFNDSCYYSKNISRSNLKNFIILLN